MIEAMDHVSKPLLGVLLAVVVFAALWMVALKPHSASGPSNPGSAPGPTPAPAPVVQPQRQTHRSAPPVRPHAVRASRAAARPAARSRPAPVVHPRTTPVGRLSAVQRALLGGKVLALLFYNPSAADDQAVKQELAGIPGHGGRVFSLAVPLSELSGYAQITSQVPVNFSPTLVIVDRAHQAQKIVGFADSFEIAQRVQDALSARPPVP
jgi:hypothetical protein